MSYGIETIKKPGWKKSTSRREIYFQMRELAEVARQHPHLTFLCCISGGGYNGWSVSEMQEVYAFWIKKDQPPSNIHIPAEMHP